MPAVPTARAPLSSTPASSPASPASPAAIHWRLIASLAAVYVIWSSTYLAMQIAIIELPPLLMSSLRFSLAGVILLVIGRQRARQRGAGWPSARQWLQVVPVGGLLFVGGNGFVGIAELSVPSGGAAVVCATMPLWTGVLAAISGEKPSRREWLSLLVGFIGVIVLMGGPSLRGEPLHLVLILLAPVCWALGSTLARRNARSAAIDTAMSSAMQMITGGALLAIVGTVRGEQLPLDAGATSWLALGYLFVFGSLIAFTAYNWLLRHARPVIATSYAYVNPPLAVLFGAAVSGEALGMTTLVANILIIGAIALAFARRAH